MFKLSILNVLDVLERSYMHDYIPGQGGEIMFMGIRGMKPVEQTSFSGVFQCDYAEPDGVHYNCTILQILKKQGTLVLKPFIATTLPGDPVTESMKGKGGVARLLPGAYKYKRGLHKGHEAWVQDSEVALLRDVDADEKFEFDSDKLDIGYFGINIHAGGPGSIGQWSAGCQVIRGYAGDKNNEYLSWQSPEWSYFHNVGYSAINSYVNYVLVPADWFESLPWFLTIGSRGSAVKRLQLLLKLPKPDGQFGMVTLRALLKYQAAMNGPKNATGIVRVLNETGTFLI